MNRPPRPVINVDALGEAIDRALAHPFVSLLENLAPKSVASVRAARDNLPETLGRLQERATTQIGAELDGFLAETLAPLLGGKKGKTKP